jgi:hypothetical protein
MALHSRSKLERQKMTMKTPPEFLKSFANRIARKILSKDGFEALRLLRQTGLLVPLSAAPAQLWHGIGADLKGQASSTGPADLDRVGIWERRNENGQTSFVRSKEAVRDWGLWANLGRIPPKKAKKRIVFVGESVARGFLYDPLFTPAAALESILQSQMGKDAIEVIDLARTNLGFEVADLAISALLLDPDLVIIFSGNNWDKSAPKSADISSVDSVLREQGIRGMKSLVEEELRQHVTALVKGVSQVYRDRNIPLVWIIPEFNLGDWRDQATNAPYLVEGGNDEWITLRTAAEQALGESNFQLAAKLAGRMVEIDHAVCVTPLYILAECSRKMGDWENTRHYLEMARDAVIWDTSKNAAPRTYAATEKALREEVTNLSDWLVDLPRIFKEYLQGEVPDRRLFVDYCHLTSEGIEVAMAAAASSVLQAFNGGNVSWRSLMGKCPMPALEVEAETAFLAAVHNAHWWQTPELVEHYCLRAAAASPKIASVMRNYLDLQSRRTPMLMCRATEEISGLGSPLMQHYLLRFNYQRLDVVLLDGIVSALKSLGIDAQKQLDQLRREEHSVTRRDINLLDYYYCTEGMQQQEVMWTVPHLAEYLSHKHNHYYKAYWLESRFVFVSEANHAVRLRLTCRVPHPGTGAETVSVQVNGRLAGEMQMGRDWEAWDITIPAAAVCSGLNKVTVRWPVPEFAGLRLLDQVGLDLQERMYPEFFCVFGEIHSFVACDAEKTALGYAGAERELSTVGTT